MGSSVVSSLYRHNQQREMIMKFAVCPSCEGTGGSSAYLGAFTSDDMHDMDDDFRDDYFSGAYDRTCTECKGRNVVPACKRNDCSAPRAFVEGYFGNHEDDHCPEHAGEDFESACESEAQHAAEVRYGC